MSKHEPGDNAAASAAPHDAAHTRARHGLVVLLAITAGSVDAWSYFGLGHVFVANMTGNTVLLFFSLGQGHWAAMMGPALGLTCYLAGVFLGSLPRATLEADSAGLWPRHVTRILSVECALLILTAAIGLWLGGHAPRLLLRVLLIGAAAVALGLQSASMQVLQVPGIMTTYLTGTWTTLVRELALCARGRGGSAAPGSQVRRLQMQATVLLAYAASAACSGLLFQHWRQGMGVLPAIACVTVVVTLWKAEMKNDSPALRAR